MESGLKQRLIGAAVLVALAVIFLPMLVQGPAPDSGVSDLPLQMPDQPAGEYETRDLPLVTPGATSTDGVLDNDDALPTVDTATAPPAANAPATSAPPDEAASSDAMLPATTAGGNYAVSFGAYGSSANADTVVTRLRTAKLPGYREQAMLAGKPAWRVRIGPYATRAEAESARIAAKEVRDIDARVIALDADEAAPATPAAPAATAPAATATAPAAKPAEPAPEAPKQAAANVGFAVQLGAFSKPAEATVLRDRVRAAGMNAFTDTVQTDKGTLTRVKAGPVLSRADADKLRAQVKAKLGIDGMVRPHP
jgi:cell division septation protein DedD